MHSLFKYTLIFTALLLPFSVLSQHLKSNQYVDNQVIVTFNLKKKIDGIDFEVTHIYQPVESDLTIYTAQKPFNAEHCSPDSGTFSLTQEIAVIRNKQLIWKGSGYFDSLEFSPNGQTLLVRQKFYHKEIDIVINNKVTMHEIKYTNNYDDDPDHSEEKMPCFRYEGVDTQLVSNTGSQYLAFFTHDGMETPLHICNFIDLIAYPKCPSIKLSWQEYNTFRTVQMVNSDEVYVLYEDKINRFSQTKIQWSTKLPDKLTARFYTFFSYKNLIVAQGSQNVALFSTENGKLLWQRSRGGEESVVQTFDSVYALNNRLIFQLEGTTINGAVDISQFIK